MGGTAVSGMGLGQALTPNPFSSPNSPYLVIEGAAGSTLPRKKNVPRGEGDVGRKIWGITHWGAAISPKKT